jgi:hypothetical protein
VQERYGRGEDLRFDRQPTRLSAIGGYNDATSFRKDFCA